MIREKIKIARQTAIEFSKAADMMEMQYRVVPMFYQERLEIIKDFHAALRKHADALGELMNEFTLAIIKVALFGKDCTEDCHSAALETRIAALEREVQDYKEENVRLLQQCLSLYRAVKKANCNLDEIEEKCEANVWFSRLKERTY